MDHPSGRRRPRLPNLEGLRAFSVLLVVLFHGRLLHVTGGFIGVSVFFTISGYLLTHRLLAKPLDGRAIRRYWAGRWHRILPAAWTVLLAIVAVLWMSDRMPVEAGRELWTTAAGLGNWFQLSRGSSYAAAIMESGDPMVHYWSLGVEEQAYLILPLVLLLLVRLRRGGLRLGTVLLLALVSFALPFVSGMSVARTYYGTDTRAGEILLGVALAVAHQSEILPRRIGRRTGNALVLVGLGGIAAIALVIHPGDDVVRRGLLPAVAVLSTILLHGAVSTRDALHGMLESEPLRFLGAVSYPVYLLHWPIMVVLRWHLPDHLGPSWYDFDPVVVTTVGLVGAALLSMPLMRFIENPLRRKVKGPQWIAWVATTAGVLLVLSMVVNPPAAAQYLSQLERDQASAASAATTVPPSTAPATTPTSTDESTPAGPSSTEGPTTTAPPPLPTVAVFGDSAALSVALLLNEQVPRDEINYVGSSTMLGCGLVHELEPERCATVPQQWTDFLALQPTDVALVLSCQWELVERDVPGAGGQAVGDPEIDEIIADGYRQAIDLLLANGVDTVAWMLCPQFSDELGDDAVAEVNRSRDPARVQALNEIAREVAAEYGDDVVLIDLYDFMQPFTDDGDLRPDGAHFSYDAPNELSVALPGMLATALAAATAAGDPLG